MILENKTTQTYSLPLHFQTSLIQLRRIFKKKLLYSSDELRKDKRVVLKSPLSCRIIDICTKKEDVGAIVDVSSGGVRITSKYKANRGAMFRIVFEDNVSKKTIFFYSILIPILNQTSQLSEEYLYRCPVHPDIMPPSELQNFYSRALSDNLISALESQQEKTIPVFKRLSEATKSAFSMGLEFKVVETVEEREQAYRLVYKEYLHRGFTDKNEEEIYTYLYQLLPQTVTFVGKRKNEVVMTMTVIKDGDFFLPLDRHFKGVLTPLREAGRNVVEYGMLAVKRDIFRKGKYSLKNFKKMAMLFPLFRLATQYVMQIQKATDVVIAIPPCHKKLYDYLCFETLTGLEYYGKYNTPAQVLKLDLLKVTDVDYMKKADRFLLYKYFFAKRSLKRKTYINKHLWNHRDLELMFVQRSKLKENLSFEDRQKLSRVCSALNQWLHSSNTLRRGEL